MGNSVFSFNMEVILYTKEAKHNNPTTAILETEHGRFKIKRHRIKTVALPIRGFSFLMSN